MIHRTFTLGALCTFLPALCLAQVPCVVVDSVSERTEVATITVRNTCSRDIAAIALRGSVPALSDPKGAFTVDFTVGLGLPPEWETASNSNQFGLFNRTSTRTLTVHVGRHTEPLAVWIIGTVYDNGMHEGDSSVLDVLLDGWQDRARELRALLAERTNTAEPAALGLPNRAYLSQRTTTLRREAAVPNITFRDAHRKMAALAELTFHEQVSESLSRAITTGQIVPDSARETSARIISSRLAALERFLSNHTEGKDN